MTGKTSLWLVRHGVTDWNVDGRLAGWSDIPLNAFGERQALALREDLKLRTFSAVWSSDLTRSLDTARLSWGEPRVDARLREIDFGRFEGLHWSKLPAEAQNDLLGFEGFHAPDGESVAQLRGRVSAFLETLPDGDNLIFTHGGVIRLLLRDRCEDRYVRHGEMIGPLRRGGGG